MRVNLKPMINVNIQFQTEQQSINFMHWLRGIESDYFAMSELDHECEEGYVDRFDYDFNNKKITTKNYDLQTD